MVPAYNHLTYQDEDETFNRSVPLKLNESHESLELVDALNHPWKPKGICINGGFATVNYINWPTWTFRDYRWVLEKILDFSLFLSLPVSWTTDLQERAGQWELAQISMETSLAIRLEYDRAAYRTVPGTGRSGSKRNLVDESLDVKPSISDDGRSSFWVIVAFVWWFFFAV